MPTAYPQIVRNYQKLGTSMMLTYFFMVAMPVMMIIRKYKVEEHFQKCNHKSNGFERTLRSRDDKIRFVQNFYFKRQFDDLESKRIGA